jgi:glycosyltransferase involved in cell wall biosynthesis
MVSIITPVLNGERFIECYFKCIFSQSFVDFEVIICDDKSDDQTKKLIDKYAKIDRRVRFINNETRSGAWFTRNQCIKLAKGRYIAFCDIDDVWKSDKLAIQISQMKAHNAAISCTNVDVIDQSGELLGERTIGVPMLSFERLLLKNYAVCSSVMYDSEIVGRPQFKNIRYAEDYELWLRILKDHSVCLLVVKDKVVQYRAVAQSESSNKIKAAMGHLRALKSFDISPFRIFFYMLTYFILSVLGEIKTIKATSNFGSK